MPRPLKGGYRQLGCSGCRQTIKTNVGPEGPPLHRCAAGGVAPFDLDLGRTKREPPVFLPVWDPETETLYSSARAG
jgi:hypothetical protein